MCSSDPRKYSFIAWFGCTLLATALPAAAADSKGDAFTPDDLQAMEMGLIFNPVVRHTDTGRPVTLRQQTIINMAKKIVEIRSKTGDDEENLRIRAKAIAELEAKKKDVADRIAAGEKIVTKNFVIPGTTPQESSQIHAQTSGLRVAGAGNGIARTQYVVQGNLFEDNESQTCGLGQNCLAVQNEKKSKQQELADSDVQTQSRALSTFQDVTIQRKRISRQEAQKLADERGVDIAEIRTKQAAARNESDKQPEKNLKEFDRSSPEAMGASEHAAQRQIDEAEEDLTAEEIYRRYFPDASLFPTKTWRRFLDGVCGVFAGPAMAYEPQDSASRTSPTSGFTREDLLAIKKATEAAKKEGVEAAREVLKNCDGCSENQEIAPVQFSEIQKHNQQRARQLLTDAEAVKKLLKPTEGAEVEPPLNEQKERTNNLPEAQKTAEAAATATEELAATDMSFVFISASLGEAALRRIIHENAGRADATLVLRGVKKGENLGKAILGIQAMVRELNEKTGETVNILIDPTLFETFRITAVPTVVRAKATQPDPLRKPEYKEIASVKGLANDQWLRSRIETGATGDQGQQGPVYEIVEPDLIEEMKRRAAAIDWEAKKNEAIARYWSNQKYEDFERAEVSRTFEIDPTVIVTADIKDADGVLIRKAGERINPLEIRPFSKEVIFFDATDIEQRARVQTYVKNRDSTARGFIDRIYISSKFDSEKGWDGYKELTDWLDAPLYQLQPGLAERFGVVRLPSVVTADNSRKVFVVKELGRKEEKTDGPNQAERHVSAEKVEENK